MDRPESLVGRAVGGAYICKDWELRVTARCLDEDLHADAETTFAAVEGLEIIKAFKKDRASEPRGPKTISPLSSGETVYRLAYGMITVAARITMRRRPSSGSWRSVATARASPTTS